MNTNEQLAAMRKEFERWYSISAFDYAANPIGSRDCGLQWEAWKAGVAYRASPPQVQRAGLTDERIDRVLDALPDGCCDEITGAEARSFARAIEAAHGISPAGGSHE